MGTSNAYWLVEDQVIYVHNVGDLTADDFREVDRQIISRLRSTFEKDPSQKVHVFVDNTDLTKLPKLSELEGGRILKYLKENNTGTTIVIGYKSNPFLKVLSPFLTHVMGASLSMTDTLENGIIELRRLDQSITDLPDLDEWKAKTLQQT